MEYRLTKSERLSSRIIIDKLFNGGNTAMSVFPLRAIYMSVDCAESDKSSTEPPVKILVSVPKRKLHRAIDRNRMKRQIREAYRLHKHELTELCREIGIRLYIGFVCLSDMPCETGRIEKSMIKILRKITEKLNQGI